MKISVRWLNEYLASPDAQGPVTADEAERALTFAGFPIEIAEPLPGGDTLLDVEVTSNRGDCLCHLGVAREVAAATGRRLRLPAPDGVFTWKASALAASVKPLPIQPGTPAASPRRLGDAARTAPDAVAIDNRTPDLCRLFTARVVRGVKVGPSPDWLVEALAAVGQRSINNVVDVTNFVAFEYGQPTHVFDLNTLAHGPAGKAGVVVRHANGGEKLRLLDGRTVSLHGDELVVADDDGSGAGRAVSLAGIMGGADTEVSGSTVDVLLEAATWDPATIRRAARRHGLRTEASFRFERIVDPRTIDEAAQRGAALIVRVAGGALLDGSVSAGAPLVPPATIRLRPARCRAMLGVDVPTPRIAEHLASIGIAVAPPTSGASANADADLACTVPPFRPDLTREIDLIEEVARTHGLDSLPIHEKVGVRVAPPQPGEVASRELARVLTGLGFYEAVTFTFVSAKAAAPFVPRGLGTLEVCDERRKADPILRPSSLPSLLACRRANQDAGVRPDGGEAGGGFRLYETAAVFAQHPPTAKGERGREVERRTLALLADARFPEGAKAAEQKQAAVRLIRGVIESATRALGGGEAAAALEFSPGAPDVSAFDPAASATIRLNGQPLGVMGLLAASVQREHDLATPVVAADLDLDPLLALYPPKSLVTPLPEFPAIERDLSLVVAETLPWARLLALVEAANPALLEETAFIGAYRGQQVGPGKKSVTLRLRFRDPARTLRHDEVDPQVATLVARAKADLGAELRA